MMGCEFCVCS